MATVRRVALVTAASMLAIGVASYAMVCGFIREVQ